MKYKLNELGEFKNGANYPKGSYGKGLKIVNVKDLFPSHFVGYSNLEELKENVLKNPEKYELKHGDILFTRSSLVQSGTGMCAMIENPEERVIYCGFIIRFRPNLDMVNPYYLTYLLRSNRYRNRFIQLAAQTTITNLNQKTLGEIEVDIPDIINQNKIAHTLYLIDNKIRNNSHINRNLLAQANAMYKEMVLDLADDEVSEGALSDIATIVMGQSPKGDTYNEEGKGEVFYQGRAEFGERFPTRRLFTTDPKRMAEVNSVLMSVRAPVGDINVAYERCCIGRGLCSVFSNDNHQSFVLYTMYSLRKDFDIYNGEGTVFGSINRDAMNNMKIRIPQQTVVDKFEELVSPIDSMIKKNYEENCRLIKIRDSLLPKLMSGDLDVSDLEI